MADRGVAHGMRYQARALAVLPAEPDVSRWMAGTTALREDNEVEVLEFDADSDTLRRVASFWHKPEIWAIAPCPEDPDRFITAHNDGTRYGATLWRTVPEKGELEARAELPGHQGVVHAALWRAGGVAATLDDSSLRSWQLGEGRAEMLGMAEGDPGRNFAGGAWDPNDSSRLATIAGNGLQMWDMRTLKPGSSIAQASKQPLRDVDWAAATRHVLSTVGDDQRLRVWDLRRADQGPLLILGGHARWVWRVRHNPVHDALVLTSAADAAVALHYLPSVRAAAAHKAPIPPPPPGRPPPDGRVHTVGDHEESVYGLEWSAADPWVFASVSYDGRIMVNRVPSQIKYKILI